MLAYTFYETDNRVMRYATTLSKRGDQVDVIALRRRGQKEIDDANGVKLYRIQEREVNETGQYSYLNRLITFTIKATSFLTGNLFKAQLNGFNAMPDFSFQCVAELFLRGEILIGRERYQ